LNAAGPAGTLLALELALARRDEAAIPGGYEAVLHEAFMEYGASGRTWTRDEILGLVRGSPITDAISIEAFGADELAPGVYLATFDTVWVDPAGGREVRRHRSSIWIRTGDRYQVRFHQGTPVPGA
jgi:hypothetical protein